MNYEKINWLNKGEAGAKPINKTNLNKMDEAISYLFENGVGGGGGDNTPIGTIFAYGGENAPEGYLIAEGQEVSRTEYVDLFNVYGTTYGEGNGSTTFNVPDYRDRVPVGLNVNTEYFNSLGKKGGEANHTLTIAEMPTHRHDVFGNPNEGSIAGVGFNTTVVGNNNFNGMAEASFSGGNQPHNNLQPYIVTNYIIKATKVTPTQAEVEDSLESNSTTNAPSIHAVNEGIFKSRKTATAFFASSITVSEATKFPFGSLLTNDNKAFSISDGGIKIGAGLSKILVSATVTLSSRNASGKNLIIYKNDTSVARSLFNTDVAIQPSIQISSKIIEVKENDVIYVYVFGENDTFSAGKDLSWLTIEAVN